MKHYKRINEVFDAPLEDGIFNYLLEETLPFEPFVDKELLNADYHGNNSGLKIVSPLVEMILGENETLTTANKQQLGKLILKKYKDNWTRIWNTYFETVYEPLENYNRIEEHDGVDKVTETPNLVTDETQTPTDWKTRETQTPTGWKETETITPTNWKETQTESSTGWKETETQTPTDWKTTVDAPEGSNSSKTEEKLYGLNSTTGVPSDSSESSSKQHSETTQTGTFKTERERAGELTTETEKSGTYKTETDKTGTYETETEQSGTFLTKKEEKGTKETATKYGMKLRVRGNIGVTTSQEMMESEIELRKYDFFQQVYNDIDKILTINIY